MRKRKPKFQKFEMPDSFLDQIYELTGGADKNKGYFLCHIDENGNCQIRHKYDSQATEFAINKLLEIYVSQREESHLIHCEGQEISDENEEDD
jgi:hypothetical protein